MNLQQIPKEKLIRECFQPEPGSLYSILDYSQIELRIMADWSNDPNMIREYKKGSEADLHSLTGALVNKLTIDQFKLLDEATRKLYRQQAKAVNFGFIYGMGANKFKLYAKSQYGVDLTLQQAREFRREFFKAYKGIKRLHNVLAADPCEVKAINVTGRIRMWEEPPGLTGISNFPVQSQSADITKLALALLYEKFKSLGFHPILNQGIKIVWTVHDEIGIEFAKEYEQIVKDNHERIMVEAGKRFIKKVPILVDAHIGTSWADK